MSSLRRAKTGRALKADGIDRVSVSCAKWLAKTIIDLRNWLDLEMWAGNPLFTMEQFKAHCVKERMEPPPVTNAWGALTRSALSRGMIEWTGEHVSAQAPDAHGRAVKLWRIV